MIRTIGVPLPAAVNGHIDLTFQEVDSWLDSDFEGFPYKLLMMLTGDEEAGPLTFLAVFAPLDEGSLPLPLPHGHDSDNWRMSVLGASRMGKAMYRPGQFRFQNGGAPYGADDLAHGPDGGYGIVFMADRRGWPVRPLKFMPQVDEAMQTISAGMGIDLPDPYPHGPAVVTQLGTMDRTGKCEGSFADVEDWPEIAPGTRMLTSILGHRTVGPILLCISAAPGAEVIPALCLNTEVQHFVYRGFGEEDGEAVPFGRIRIQLPGASSGALVAGSEGMQHVVVIADRSAVLWAAGKGSAWIDQLAEQVTHMVSSLGPEIGCQRKRPTAR